MKNEFYDDTKQAYVQPVSVVYELCLESSILQASSEGVITDPDDDGEGSISLLEFKYRNF